MKTMGKKSKKGLLILLGLLPLLAYQNCAEEGKLTDPTSDFAFKGADSTEEETLRNANRTPANFDSLDVGLAPNATITSTTKIAKSYDFEKYNLGVWTYDYVKSNLKDIFPNGVYLKTPSGMSPTPLPITKLMTKVYSNYNSMEISNKYYLSGGKSLRLQNNGKDINYSSSHDMQYSKARNEIAWALDNYFFRFSMDLNKDKIIQDIEKMGWSHGEERMIRVNYYWPCAENNLWMACPNNTPTQSGSSKAIIFQVFGEQLSTADNSPILHMTIDAKTQLAMEYSYSRKAISSTYSSVANTSAIEEGSVYLKFPSTLKMQTDKWMRLSVYHKKHFLPELSQTKIYFHPSKSTEVLIYDSNNINGFLNIGGEITVSDKIGGVIKAKYTITKAGGTKAVISGKAVTMTTSQIEALVVKNGKLLFGNSPEKFPKSNVKAGLYCTHGLVSSGSKAPVVVYLDDLYIEKLNPIRSDILTYINKNGGIYTQ